MTKQDDTSYKRFARIPFSVLLRSDLPATAKLIYGFLTAQWHMSGRRSFRIGLKKIAHATGTSQRTVSSALWDLRGRPAKTRNRDRENGALLEWPPLIQVTATGRSNRFKILNVSPSVREDVCHEESREADTQTNEDPHKRDVFIEHEHMTPKSKDFGGAWPSTAFEECILKGRVLMESEDGRNLLEAVRKLGYDYDHDIEQVQHANRQLLH
mgnify:FL=1